MDIILIKKKEKGKRKKIYPVYSFLETCPTLQNIFKKLTSAT